MAMIARTTIALALIVSLVIDFVVFYGNNMTDFIIGVREDKTIGVPKDGHV